jgi:hypothetical protein
MLLGDNATHASALRRAPYRNRKRSRALQSSFYQSSKSFAASTAWVSLQLEAIGLPNHFDTGLEYSGPISAAVTLDDPADVTLLCEEPFVGWSSISPCLSGAAGLCPPSANLLQMFIIVETNFVDSERRAGS